MSSSDVEPNAHCDCREKSIRNVRLIALVIGFISLVGYFIFQVQHRAVLSGLCMALGGLGLLVSEVARMYAAVRPPRFATIIVVCFGGLVVGLGLFMAITSTV